MARIPSVANGLLDIGAPGAGLVVGSAAWSAWLARDSVRSFAFRSPEGNYTARKERRRRGGAYWVAYRTAGGRLHKAYLGKADELTSARLAEAAASLAGLVEAPAPPDSSARARGAGEDVLILATKLFAPRPRRDLVARPRLLDRLDAGLDRAGAPCSPRRPAPARPRCWPRGCAVSTARSPGSPSTRATRTRTSSCAT